jgi:hypothetical protein
MTVDDFDAGPELPEHLFSEGWLFAALFDMVEQHCGATEADRLKSFGWSANARAMRLLNDAAYIAIDSQEGNQIEAHVLPKARDLMARVAAEEEAERQRRHGRG